MTQHLHRRAAGALACLAALFAASPHAHAEPYDTYGGLPREASMAGADMVFSHGEAAAHLNPAQAVNDEAVRVSFGYSHFSHRFDIDGRDAAVEDHSGMTFALGLPWKVEPLSMALNLIVYAPERRLVRIRKLPDSQPRFLLYDNRVRRLVVQAAYAVRWGPVSVGAGVGAFADAAGEGIRFAIQSGPGKPQRADADLDLQLRAKYYPLAGLLVEPVEGLRFAFSYRGEVKFHIGLKTTADLDIDQGFARLTGDAAVAIGSINFFTPDRFAFGAGWESDLAPDWHLAVTALAAWLRWSRFDGTLAKLDLALNLRLASDPFAIDVLQNPPVERRYRDAVLVAGGTEAVWDAGEAALEMRLGYAFQTTPVPDQPGALNILDSNRHTVAFGLGFRMDAATALLPEPPTIEGFFQAHVLMPRRYTKTEPDAPVPSFSTRGHILGGGVQASFAF